jgi:hypothetical protein
VSGLTAEFSEDSRWRIVIGKLIIYPSRVYPHYRVIELEKVFAPPKAPFNIRVSGRTETQRLAISRNRSQKNNCLIRTGRDFEGMVCFTVFDSGKVFFSHIREVIFRWSQHSKLWLVWQRTRWQCMLLSPTKYRCLLFSSKIEPGV